MCLAIPGKIVRLLTDDPLSRMAEVSFGGVKKEINLAFVPEAQVGEYVIVHVGFAISRLDEEEAAAVLQAFRELDEAARQEAMDEIH